MKGRGVEEGDGGRGEERNGGEGMGGDRRRRRTAHKMPIRDAPVTLWAPEKKYAVRGALKRCRRSWRNHNF